MTLFGYIEKGYGIFHCEGDEVVLDDITEFLEGKGIKINASFIRWIDSLAWKLLFQNGRCNQMFEICGGREEVSEVTILKEKMDFTIDLLITMAVEEITERQERTVKKY